MSKINTLEIESQETKTYQGLHADLLTTSNSWNT